MEHGNQFGSFAAGGGAAGPTGTAVVPGIMGSGTDGAYTANSASGVSGGPGVGA